ncbi:hypothetical protein D9M69_731800 [compost metagenome]
MVASENTTPQPKVSYGRLRSITVTSFSGFCSFMSRPKYRPAGPPPMQAIFIAVYAPWYATTALYSWSWGRRDLNLDSLGLKYIPDRGGLQMGKVSRSVGV